MKLSFLEKEQIRTEQIPAILIYFDGTYYPYDGNKESKSELLHYISRLVHPILSLDSEEEL